MMRARFIGGPAGGKEEQFSRLHELLRVERVTPISLQCMADDGRHLRTKVYEYRAIDCDQHGVVLFLFTGMQG